MEGYESLPPGVDLLNKDNDGDSVGITSSSSPTHHPVKRQTRKWAAWTRQEEESFFNALRQIGKNFEMIKCRVQTKNKDQVRHYYYRLVRRMNKLLGPEFSLDAKNSKDTNAAMLRWWSLLEKYSCKASKLHLKPRRFKIFIEALEHQLLKDKKKNTRKRPSQNENSSSSSPANHSIQSKAPGHETRSVKMVLVDSQNIQKITSGKGSLVKRSVNNGTNRSNRKGDMSTLKTTRQRRKKGPASSADYKRWEKAAIAGVSLVADAAEHLERTTMDKMVLPDEAVPEESFPSSSLLTKTTDGQNAMDSVRNILPHVSLPSSSQHQITETSAQASLKLQLQLFPIDEATRTVLEKEEHNPHLELTLSARKKIASVLEHLNRKWGKSSIAVGELVLFPYTAQRENLGGHQRWTQETVASASDVYTSIGSTHLFRLRYGWFCSTELMSVASGSPLAPLFPQEDSMSLNIWNNKEQNEDQPEAITPDRHTSHDSEHLMEPFGNQLTPVMEDTDLTPCTDFPEDLSEYVCTGSGDNLNSTDCEYLWLRKQTGDGTIRRRWEKGDNVRTSSDAQLSAGDWADSLTNMSAGELLSEISQMETDSEDPSVIGSDQYLHQVPFSCDSFDAAIAAHIAGRSDDLPSVEVSHAPSIWDAEETCDAFSFRKLPPPKQYGEPISSRTCALETCKPIASTTSISFRGLAEELHERNKGNIACEGVSVNNCDSNANKPDDSTKNLGGLADLFWPESLGPLDLGTSMSKYQGQDLIFGDSIGLSGLNRLIANSLDAFQNCIFFGLDKAASPACEGRETAPFLDRKIGGEV